MLTISGKQSSNNCDHITQWKIEMSILVILKILSCINDFQDEQEREVSVINWAMIGLSKTQPKEMKEECCLMLISL